MNSPRKPLVVLIAALCAGLAFDSSAAKKKEKTIGDLTARPVVVQPDQKVEASSQRAMESYRRFLELQKTDPQLRAEALRRLADLNMEAGEGDRLAGEASVVDTQGAEAIKLYTNLLKSYPDYPRNDQVLYQLARAYETTGQPEKALATLDDILRKYPKSPQMDEVQFRRGELLFSADEGGERCRHVSRPSRCSRLTTVHIDGRPGKLRILLEDGRLQGLELRSGLQALF